MQSVKFSLGTNDMGVETRMECFEDGMIITEDYQSADVIQAIKDKCAEYRRLEAEGNGKTGFRNMRMVASLPVTIFNNWRRMWDAQYRQYMNWHEFYYMMINRREYADFKCTNARIECPQWLKEVGDHAPEPSLPTAMNAQRQREAEGVEYKGRDPYYIPLTGRDDAIRINC